MFIPIQLNVEFSLVFFEYVDTLFAIPREFFVHRLNSIALAGKGVDSPVSAG